jgi:hypothetical protein
MISKYYEVPNWPAPTPSKQGNYGVVKLTQQLSLFDVLYATFSTNATNVAPQTFEQLGLNRKDFLFISNKLCYSSFLFFLF